MPDYYPTSVYFASTGSEAWTPNTGTVPAAIDEVGANNGDTDYIQTSGSFEGWGDAVPPYTTSLVVWLTETDLPIADPTDLTGAVLKVQAKLAASDPGLSWSLKAILGIGDPSEGLYIGNATFHQVDVGSSYTELSVPVNDALLPSLEPSNLRVYAILNVWHA